MPLGRNYTLDHFAAVALVSRREPKPDHDGYLADGFLLDKRSSHALKRKSVAVKEFTLNRCPA